VLSIASLDMKKPILFLLIIPVVFGVLAAITSEFLYKTSDVSNVEASNSAYLAESSKLTQQEAPHRDFELLFTELAQEKGGEVAFDLMKVAELPFGLDTHLLGHSIGEILFKQRGIAGMSLCTHDFRNACSHTMVIGALLEEGTSALPQIREACHAAPGGPGAYTMCFHGLGHGVLAFNGYSMERTIDMCDELGTAKFNDREAVECFGGAIMEIIGGGGHDPEIWSEQREKYLTPDNPFGICQQSFVTDKYRPMCYNYMTPYAYEAFGADMSAPSDSVFTAVFKECEKISHTENALRQSCFGGQGKEFIGLAVGRNFSSDLKPTVKQLGQMRDWCALATSKDGYTYCSEAVVSSLYWGGENPFATPLEYCSLQPSENHDDCIFQMIRNVSFYNQDTGYRQAFCEALPESNRQQCVDQLL
jgi:hypothetical protein